MQGQKEHKTQEDVCTTPGTEEVIAPNTYFSSSDTYSIYPYLVSSEMAFSAFSRDKLVKHSAAEERT